MVQWSGGREVPVVETQSVGGAGPLLQGRGHRVLGHTALLHRVGDQQVEQKRVWTGGMGGRSAETLALTQSSSVGEDGQVEDDHQEDGQEDGHHDGGQVLTVWGEARLS